MQLMIGCLVVSCQKPPVLWMKTAAEYDVAE